MLSRAASESLAALDSISVEDFVQTCTYTLNNFFNNSGNFWVPPRKYSAPSENEYQKYPWG